MAMEMETRRGIGVKMEKEIGKYIKKTFRNFIKSFKSLDRTMLYIVVYKLVFYLAVLAFYGKFVEIMVKRVQPVFAMVTTTVSPESKELLKAQIGTIKGFYWSIAIYAIIFALILFLIYALTNLFIWSAITDTKLRKSRASFILKFYGLSAIWFIAWSVLVLMVIWSIKINVVLYWFLAIALLYSHLTTLLYISYFKGKGLGKSIKSSFNTGFAKLQNFILPYVFAALVFLLLNILLIPLGRIIHTNLMTVYFIVFIFYFAWLRLYIYSFARDLV